MSDISIGIFTGVVFWLTTKRITKFLKEKKSSNELICVTSRQGICDERDILTCVNSQV
jgi:hypothetical protein